MNKFLQFVFVLFLISAIGCKSYSRYAIDEKPLIRTDSLMYGIWKAVEDTDKADFILVQSPYDLYHGIDWWYHLDTGQKRAYLMKRDPGDTEWIRLQMEQKPDMGMLSVDYNKFIQRQYRYYYI